MLARLITAVVLMSAHLALAETVVVRNVNGYALQADRLEKFATLVVVDGKVDRLFAAGASVPAIANATVIDGKGQTLLPGLIDAHGHVASLGQLRAQADLRGSASVEIALDRIRKFASEKKDAKWIVGQGWNQVLWPERQFPTAKQLDAVAADRPALMSRIDGHAVWVNSAALKLAGITRATADPSGGQIVRDAQGNPTGVLVDNATALVEKLLPPATDAETKDFLSTALNELASLGLTGVHDAGIDPHTYDLYQQLGKQNQLPVRVYAMLADNKEARELIKLGPRPPLFDDRLQLRAVKAWVDGALGSRGAAFLQDYSDQPGHRGLTLYTQEEMQKLAELTAEYHWQLCVHAIGDAGNRTALNAFERGMSSSRRIELRPRIEHAQVIALNDIPRFKGLNVIASIQPTHATSDMNMAEDRVGAQRIQGAYAWRKLKNAGARLAGGSDFPVELANPFHGLYAAVTRKGRDGKPPGGWYAQEKLTREEALRLFSSDAAYAAGMEDRIGSLARGQWADFILIDRDFFVVPEDQIDDIAVQATYVGGKQVFAATTK